MAKTRKIILWGREDVLGCSVEIFLSTLKEWEVVRRFSEQSDEGLKDVIEREKPDVVLLNLDSSNQTLPVRLIQFYPGVKVITVDLNNNTIEIYNKQELCISAVSDFLYAVES